MRVFTQVFGVAGAMPVRDGKILLVREAGGVDAGKWNHPAGWIEVGEDPLEAAQREVLEETGYTFTPEKLLGIYSLVRKDLSNRMPAVPHCIKLIFTGSLSESATGELHQDIREARWFFPEEILAMAPDTLRDRDIKQMVSDLAAGKNYPVSLLKHTIAA